MDTYYISHDFKYVFGGYKSAGSTKKVFHGSCIFGKNKPVLIGIVAKWTHPTRLLQGREVDLMGFRYFQTIGLTKMMLGWNDSLSRRSQLRAPWSTHTLWTVTTESSSPPPPPPPPPPGSVIIGKSGTFVLLDQGKENSPRTILFTWGGSQNGHDSPCNNTLAEVDAINKKPALIVSKYQTYKNETWL